MNAYATSEQLATWLGGAAPADADRLLLRASELIDAQVVAAFDTDDNGIPTDAEIAAVLSDAACAQVEMWLEVGEANDVDGLAGSAVNVGGYSGRRAPRVSPRALDLLREGGLLTLSWGAQLGSLWPTETP